MSANDNRSETADENGNWKFDQAENVGAVTTRAVIDDNQPILLAIHYGDDCSWAFLCDTTEKESDSRMVTMKEIVEKDPTLLEIADLPPGWIAYRDFVGDEWDKFEEGE